MAEDNNRMGDERGGAEKHNKLLQMWKSNEGSGKQSPD